MRLRLLLFLAALTLVHSNDSDDDLSDDDWGDFPDPDAPERPVFALGCLGGCIYVAQNIVQMQACGTVGQQRDAGRGTSLRNFFSCQLPPTEEKCNATKSFPDGKDCAWAQIPKQHVADYGEGTCMLTSAAGTAVLGFDIAFGELNKLKQKHGIKKIPIAQQQAECLQHSWNQTACEEAEDTLGEKCGWCEGIDMEVFRIAPPTTGFCFQSTLVGGVCDMMKDDPTKELCLPTKPPVVREYTGATQMLRIYTKPSGAFTVTASSSLLAVAYFML